MSKGYITNGTTQDGFGARMHRVINTMAFTFFLRDKYGVDIEYVHTPFAFEGFGENFSTGEQARSTCGRYEISRKNYIERAELWDNRLSYSGLIISDIDLDSVNVVDTLDFDKNQLFTDVAKNQTDDKLYFVKYLHRELSSGIVDTNIIKNYYREIKNHFQFTQSSNNNVILHIRRSDAVPMPDRFLSDEYYLEILNALIPYKDKYNITIHTQRKGFDHAKYVDWTVVCDDEEEDYDLFVKMVDANLLIIGKSSISVAAGFLNENVVVYPPQPTNGLSSWINKDEFIKSLK